MSYFGGDLPTLEIVIGITADLLNVWTDLQAGKIDGTIGLGAESIRERLSDAWRMYQAQASYMNEQLLWVDKFGQMMYRDTYTALTISHFEVARILLGLISQSVSGSLTASSTYTSSASIIHIANFMDRGSPVCAYVRVLFPLTIVALYGMPDQRGMAQHIFREWYQLTKLAAWGAMALDMIPRFNLPLASECHKFDHKQITPG